MLTQACSEAFVHGVLVPCLVANIFIVCPPLFEVCRRAFRTKNKAGLRPAMPTGDFLPLPQYLDVLLQMQKSQVITFCLFHLSMYVLQSVARIIFLKQSKNCLEVEYSLP